MVLAVSAGGSWFRSDVLNGLQRSSALAGDGARSGDGSENILLIGLDSRRDNDGNDLPSDVLDKLHAGSSSDVGGYNANTLIVVHIPAGGLPATAVSIPRDDYVLIPGLGAHKIKEAYGRAKAAAETAAFQQGTATKPALEQVGREAGRRATIDVVRNLLDVPIDHFAEVNLAGFYDVAVALGGVTVCLNKAVSDEYSGADFPAGVQTLDGDKALAFVRQRHGLPAGDLDRTRRQQAFLGAVQRKLGSEGVFSDLGKLQSLLDAMKKDVIVDSSFDVMDLASRSGSLGAGRITFQTLPIEKFALREGQDVNLVDPEKIRVAAHQLFGMPAYVPAPAATPGPASTANAASADVVRSALLNAASGSGAGSDTEDSSDIPCVN